MNQLVMYLNTLSGLTTFPSPLGFEGLIDEVNLYLKPPGHKNMQSLYNASKPKELDADMQSEFFQVQQEKH